MGKKYDAADDAELVTFVPIHNFTGYPDGKKTEFRAGIESIPVSKEFAQLMRDKGHVEGN